MIPLNKFHTVFRESIRLMAGRVFAISVLTLTPHTPLFAGAFCIQPYSGATLNCGFSTMDSASLWYWSTVKPKPTGLAYIGG